MLALRSFSFIVLTVFNIHKIHQIDNTGIATAIANFLENFLFLTLSMFAVLHFNSIFLSEV
jgi:hypothetical protein